MVEHDANKLRREVSIERVQVEIAPEKKALKKTKNKVSRHQSTDSDSEDLKEKITELKAEDDSMKVEEDQAIEKSKSTQPSASEEKSSDVESLEDASKASEETTSIQSDKLEVSKKGKKKPSAATDSSHAAEEKAGAPFGAKLKKTVVKPKPQEVQEMEKVHLRKHQFEQVPVIEEVSPRLHAFVTQFGSFFNNLKNTTYFLFSLYFFKRL